MSDSHLTWYRYDGQIVSYIFGNILIQICHHCMIQIIDCMIQVFSLTELYHTWCQIWHRLALPKMYDSCLISDLTQHDNRLIQFPTPGCVLLTIFAELLVCKSVSSSCTPLSIMMTYYFMGLQNDITKKSSCLSRISSLILVPEVLLWLHWSMYIL